MGEQNKVLGKHGLMWGVVIPMAECRNGAKLERNLGDKASLLFPYPEVKCFEILGRTHSS